MVILLCRLESVIVIYSREDYIMKKTGLTLPVIILLVVLGIVVVAGVTYAAFTWQSISEEERSVSGSTECFNINYTKGQDIGSNEEKKKLYLGRSYLDGLSTTVDISVDSTCNINEGTATIYINTDSESSSYFIDNKLINYAVLVDGTVVSSGTIESTENYPVYSDFTVTNEIVSITVYIWLNGELVTNDNITEVLNLEYIGKITATAEGR